MEKTLTGKTAFITGSGRGLGWAIASRLAEQGANVALHDISQTAPAEFGEAATLNDVAEKLRVHGGRVTAVTGDIADESAVIAMTQQVIDALGKIDILVNCAGGDIAAKGGKPKPNNVLDIPFEDVRALIDRNLIGTILVSRTVCPAMRERRQGRVINIASVAAHIGVSEGAMYAVAKAGVVQYTRCLAQEMREFGICVNAISPGPTRTARFLVTRELDPAMMAADGSLIRYALPEEIADAVAFLAGDASSFITGQVLRVDGGYSIFAA